MCILEYTFYESAGTGPGNKDAATVLQKMAFLFWKYPSFLREAITMRYWSFLVKGRYQLCTEKPFILTETKYDNFANAFRQISLEGVNDVLVLGLGLASIPYILEKIHHKDFVYTGVEIDEEVVLPGQQICVGWTQKWSKRIYHRRLYFYVHERKSFWPHLHGCFVDDLIPEELESLDFTEMLRDTWPQVVNSYTIDSLTQLKIRREQNIISKTCSPKFSRWQNLWNRRQPHAAQF